MKLKILLLLLSTAFLSSFGQVDTKEFNIAGIWQATSNEQKFILTFDKEGYATLQKGNDIIGGKEFTMNGEKGCMTYKLDYTQKPVQLDIIITQLSTGGKKVIMGILKIISEDEFLLTMNPNTRPTDFEADDVKLFTRVK